MNVNQLTQVSTHSRPKAAGSVSWRRSVGCFGFQHTAARRRLACRLKTIPLPSWFQHTAARRRLDSPYIGFTISSKFQHTAARRRLVGVKGLPSIAAIGFNTQPPEGGWI